MINTNEYGKLLFKLGFEDFSGVPCSYLAPLINYAINSERFIMSNNEGDAIAIAAGISITNLSGIQNCTEDTIINQHASCPESKSNNSKSGQPKFPVVLMQNSGLSNALSPLTSLTHTFRIPLLGFVSLRGERDENGKNTDEPQHELLGVITDKLLETCDISYAFLSRDFDEASKQLIEAKKVLLNGGCFFFIVRDKTFSKVELRQDITADFDPINTTKKAADKASATTTESNVAKPESKTPLPARLQALKSLHELALSKQAILLATTGKGGRELYEIGDTPNQLYMVGSMGCISPLGLGISLKAPQKIIAIDGDSALLMRLGALSTNAFYAKRANKGNFCHILLDNHSHDSTGGQFNLSPFVDFCVIAKSCGYDFVKKAQDIKEFKKEVASFLDRSNGGATFIYMRISKGSKENLGRPKITPQEVARRLSAYISSQNHQKKEP